MSTPVKEETPEQIAERITRDYGIALSDTGKRGLRNEILSALRNEREACAKLAETHLSDYRNNLSASSVATAIRGRTE